MPHKKGKTAPKKSFPIWIAAVAFLVVLVAAAGIVLSQQRAPAATQLPAEISVAQAAQAQKDGAFVLDVRQLEEWAQGHISGATLIPLEELPNRLSEVPRNREVVVVCRTGIRSAEGRDVLKSAGFTRVTSMAGGLTQWQAQGMPLVTGQ